MAIQTRSTLKSVFEQGDTPQGSNYADLIDTFLALADTTVQAITSPVTFNGAVNFAGAVSAASLTVGGIVSANHVETSSARIQTVSANRIRATTVTAGAITVSGDVTIGGDLTVSGNLDFGSTPHGEVYLTAAVAVSASASYVEIATNASSASTLLKSFALTAGSLQYTGAGTRTFQVIAALTIRASGANTQTIVTFCKDTSAIARLEEEGDVGTGDMSILIHGLKRLAQNERIGVCIKGDEAAAAGWVIDDMVMTIHEV